MNTQWILRNNTNKLVFHKYMSLQSIDTIFIYYIALIYSFLTTLKKYYYIILYIVKQYYY